MGLNFDDVLALMAFRIRRKAGGTIWAGGSYRRPGGTVAVLVPGDVSFRRLATWRSPENGAAYPVKQQLVIRIDGRLASWILGAAVRRAGTDAVRDIVEFLPIRMACACGKRRLAGGELKILECRSVATRRLRDDHDRREIRARPATR